MEMKIKLDMIPPPPSVSLCFPSALLFLSRHFLLCLSLLLFPVFPGRSPKRSLFCLLMFFLCSLQQVQYGDREFNYSLNIESNV